MTQTSPDDMIDELQNIDRKEEVMYQSYVKCVTESLQTCEDCDNFKISVLNHDFLGCDCKD